MAVVPIRLNREDARKLDLLVKLKIYRSRTEAIRDMIRAEADELVSRYMLSERVLRVLDQLVEHEERLRTNPLRIVARKTAAEIVAESRE